jgi:spermidine synthase
MRLTRLVPYALSFISSLAIMVLELVASRLVAQHVGASLLVWTSVIGIILAGICLGNVLGGRLADRVPSRLALGTLYALAAALTLASLWINGFVGRLPGLDSIIWDLRTLIVVSLDFLVPATVLGMISPVVAKMAVEQSKRTGSAIGDVYFWGAVGSITGTFLAGFWLISLAPTSTIVAVVAAALALLAFALSTELLPRMFSAGACVLLVVGALPSMGAPFTLPELTLLPFKLNVVAAVAHVLAIIAAVTAWVPLGTLLSIGPQQKLPPRVEVPGLKTLTEFEEKTPLGDLAVLAFLASLAFMALEMVAGRLVTRHLGSSVYGWTSVIGVLLGGLSMGNWLGGKIANFIKNERSASTLFMFASAMVLSIILLETPPDWVVKNPIGYLFGGEPPRPLIDDPDTDQKEGVLQLVSSLSGQPWGLRVLIVTALQFLLPAIALGTVSPVVAKLAIDRVSKTKRMGAAIGSVYAWGMVGSILGTFLTGFMLIDILGTKGVLIVTATLLALAATALGSIWHAAWAGIPLGLCVITFLPPLIPTGIKREIPLPGNRAVRIDTTGIHDFLIRQGQGWGLREPNGEPDNPEARTAYIDESNYYYIKVNNALVEGGTKRTLVLDNLIHGYELLGQPTRLDYDYEHIYALVTQRLMQAKAKRLSARAPAAVELGTLFLGGGSYTFPRYLQATYPRTWAEIAEIDPAVTRANHMALGLPWPEPQFPEPQIDKKTGREVVKIQGESIDLGASGSAQSRTAYLKALERIAPAYELDQQSGEAVVSLEGRRIPLGPHGSDASRARYLEEVQRWFDTSKYRIRTTWGDARQYAVKHQASQFDIVFGDAFNDFSVPWHLTTKEFNDLIYNMLTPEGVYMINIIDLYDSDEHAAKSGPRRALEARLTEALAPRWRGSENAKEVSTRAVNFLMNEALTKEWDRMGTWAALAFDGKVQEQSIAELAADLRHARDAKPPTTANTSPEKSEFQVPTHDDLQSSLRAVYANAHANASVSILDGERARIAFRLKNKTEVRSAVTAAFEGIRAEASGKNMLSDRVEVIDQTLDILVKTADALGSIPPEKLLETVSGLASQLEREVTDGRLTQERSRTILLLISEIHQQSTGLVEGESPLEAARARTQAVRNAKEIATELRSARVRITSELQPLITAALQDQELADATVPVVQKFLSDREAWIEAAANQIYKARQAGGFLGSWVATAKLTFPHVYVYGTHTKIGTGQRETFVVVASKVDLNLNRLGLVEGDIAFETDGAVTIPEIYPPNHMSALQLRSHKLILTDDHAPVENLLAPVAATRGDD